jgi:hypothetical protein
MNPRIIQLLGAVAAMALQGCALEAVESGVCPGCSTSSQAAISSTDAGVVPVVSQGEAAACAAWQSVHDRQTQTATWTAGAAQCDRGSLPEPTRAASIEWVNYYRGLVGLAPVTEAASDRAPAQACAVLLERNGQLSHTPPSSWACADLMSRDAAARSNLSGNPGFPMSPWYAVRGWIDEGRDLSDTLGHRRWILSPELHSMSYGQTASFACMTLGLGARDARAPRWVAWPPPGWVPSAVMGTIWSLSKPGIGAPGTQVQVLRDGVALPVSMTVRRSGAGDDTISWEVPSTTGASVYRVRVTVPGEPLIEYEVRRTSCARQ